ncbi:MAG TPA: hypothetical protein PKI59_05725, partial [Candidatus Cloacimonadota bacterium]|nr:hypothetical protein [Candidatus Cloacimonadota bacterium]
SIVAITEFSDDRVASFNLLRWLSHHYGFGSYIHYIRGPLTIATNNEAKKILQNLINKAHVSEAGFYVDTIVAPTFKTAVAQIVQIPGITGMDNNSILFSFYKDNPQEIAPIIEGCYFAAITSLNALILRSGTRHFGFRRLIDIWLTKGDYRNANLMILLAYILIGHPEWKDCQIRVFDVIEQGSANATDGLEDLIATGRLPISANNIQKVTKADSKNFSEVVCAGSMDADLIILGLSLKKMRKDNGAFMAGFTCTQDMLFVRAGQKILISTDESEEDLAESLGEQNPAEAKPDANVTEPSV